MTLKKIILKSINFSLSIVLVFNILMNLLGLKNSTNMAISWQKSNQIVSIIELLLLLLFMQKRTRNISFFLLCSYLGGSIAICIQEKNDFFVPLSLLLGFWLAMFLQNGWLFNVYPNRKKLFGIILKK